MSLAILLEAASVSGQFTEPSKVLPPPVQKTTVSGNITPVQVNQTLRQSPGQTKIELLGPTPPIQVRRATPGGVSLTAGESAPSDSASDETEESPLWLSAPSVNWFTLAPKDFPKSWEPASSAGTSFDRSTKTDTNSWQPKPKGSFDTPPPGSNAHSWDDPRNPRSKGAKSGWK